MIQNCWLSRVIEEIFPIPYYLVRKCRLYNKANSENLFEKHVRYVEYLSLEDESLRNRLQEERDRAIFLDEKTFKMTLSLSVGLTVLGAVIATLTKILPENMWQLSLIVTVGIGVLYILSAGLVAISSLRTYPSYGYGTHILLINNDKEQTKTLAESLARQEIMNNIRHVRNEAVYQALRNGLFLISFAILLLGLTFAANIMV